jgi:CheY-like chemotaxis protein
VDDEEMVRSFVVSALRGAGYRPLAAREGEEAIELLRRHAADVRLALLDVVMPGMGGIELARRLRTIRPDLRIVFSSGFDPDGGEPPGEGDAFLPKPYALAQLLAMVRGQLAPAGA